MRRWLERLKAVVMVVVIAGLLLACWAPAYVGATTQEPHSRRSPLNRPAERPARR